MPASPRETNAVKQQHTILQRERQRTA
jgi:hypothetical protein